MLRKAELSLVLLKSDYLQEAGMAIRTAPHWNRAHGVDFALDND